MKYFIKIFIETYWNMALCQCGAVDKDFYFLYNKNLLKE